jgi:environmental stress-induced protein Ves
MRHVILLFSTALLFWGCGKPFEYKMLDGTSTKNEAEYVEHMRSLEHAGYDKIEARAVAGEISEYEEILQREDWKHKVQVWRIKEQTRYKMYEAGATDAQMDRASDSMLEPLKKQSYEERNAQAVKEAAQTWDKALDSLNRLIDTARH